MRIGFGDKRVLGDQETGGRAALPILREIMLRVYRDELVGPVPEFPSAIEEGIQKYLARRATLETSREEPPRPALDDELIAPPTGAPRRRWPPTLSCTAPADPAGRGLPRALRSL